MVRGWLRGWEGSGEGGGQSVIKCKCCAEAKGTLRGSVRVHSAAQVLEQANATFPETEFQGAGCLGILSHVKVKIHEVQEMEDGERREGMRGLLLATDGTCLLRDGLPTIAGGIVPGLNVVI